MKRLISALAIAVLCTFDISAQKTVSVDSNADKVIKWWDNSTAPHSNEETADEAVSKSKHFTHTSETVFYVFNADPANATGHSVVILPGGGYSKVCIAHEGFALAEWFKRNGITAVVVKYRLPNLGHKEVPLEDAQAAMKYLRDNAREFNLDPAKVGICGSSAGGHLAAYASNFTPDAEKPAFTILFYPVITGTTWSNIGQFNTIRQLLGEKRTPVEVEKYSAENMVSESTPPTIMLHCNDDYAAQPINSILYYKALKRHGVKATMHIYPSGGHGWAGNEKFKYTEDYRRHLLDWLSALDKE